MMEFPSGVSVGTRPLDGVRILDLSQIGAGPYGTSMLGDLGADVIKVEPLTGDSFRFIDDGFARGDSAYFFGVNRSKRAMTLDLKSDEGREVLREMIPQVDVIVLAFRPDAVRRMGLDYETLRELNPRLIHASVTAFGEDGPRAGEPGMDILAQALSGMMGVTGEVGGGPVKVGVPIADFVGSFFLGFGICAALNLRERTGLGDQLTVNLLDGQIAAFANYITAYDRTKVPFRPQGGGHPQLVPYQPFVGSDGQYFILAVLNDKFWRKLGPMLAQSEDAEYFADPKFERNVIRIEHRDELCARLQRHFLTRPAAEWEAELQSIGVPSGPINRMEDVLEEPQVVHNKSISTLEHPIYGSYKVPNNPLRFKTSPVGPRGYAPGLGEHTEDILREMGIEESRIQSLINQGIVSSDPWADKSTLAAGSWA
jgi:crotonobetainyl-CoA:carnitine CoA-transferase CaiB-like acyl-CoA transferase